MSNRQERKKQNLVRRLITETVASTLIKDEPVRLTSEVRDDMVKRLTAAVADHVRMPAIHIKAQPVSELTQEERDQRIAPRIDVTIERMK